MARGKRPVSFRTRKLSLSAPMVLPWRRGGRVGRRRTTIPEGAPASVLGPLRHVYAPTDRTSARWPDAGPLALPRESGPAGTFGTESPGSGRVCRDLKSVSGGVLWWCAPTLSASHALSVPARARRSRTRSRASRAVQPVGRAPSCRDACSDLCLSSSSRSASAGSRRGRGPGCPRDLEAGRAQPRRSPAPAAAPGRRRRRRGGTGRPGRSPAASCRRRRAGRRRRSARTRRRCRALRVHHRALVRLVRRLVVAEADVAVGPEDLRRAELRGQLLEQGGIGALTCAS